MKKTILLFAIVVITAPAFGKVTLQRTHANIAYSCSKFAVSKERDKSLTLIIPQRLKADELTLPIFGSIVPYTWKVYKSEWTNTIEIPIALEDCPAMVQFLGELAHSKAGVKYEITINDKLYIFTAVGSGKICITDNDIYSRKISAEKIKSALLQAYK